jgi:hypothetical protein
VLGIHMKKKLPVSVKYQLYESSVQAHEADIEFIHKEYKKIFKCAPLVLREDFGGTAIMACEWVVKSPKHKAYSIDLDLEPINYGMQNHWSKLTPSEKKRMHYVHGNVLSSYSFKPDVIVAFNFSYFIFKKREELLSYFKKVRKSLGRKGAFFLDIFGGTECHQILEEKTKFKGHTYFWDCRSFNPINNECIYYIHFKTHKDGIKHEKVFKYDWRHWGLPELREILLDAGFSRTLVFWEGDGENGEGNGEFRAKEKEENCQSWISYIMALP